MANVTVTIPHQLPRAEAKKRVENLIGQLQQEYSGFLTKLDQRWTGDTLDFTCSGMGVSISGQVHVEDQLVRLELALPAPLAMFAGSLQKTIDQEGRKLLGHQ